MRTAKLFRNGKNQAVRLPRQFEFGGVNEVSIRKEGNAIVLLPLRKSWVSYAALPAADDDFMPARHCRHEQRQAFQQGTATEG